MSLRAPNLDDRTFESLLREALSYAESSSGWKPSNPNDPGTILLELFAYLTDLLSYRVNRLPEKAYVELLRLIGVKLQPPSAAMTRLRFTLKEPQGRKITIRQDIRVSSQDNNIEFITLHDAHILPGEESVDITAIHSQWEDFQVVGEGNGRPGLSFRLPHAPIIASSPDRIDLILAVEAKEDELTPESNIYKHNNGKIYQIWDEVESFSDKSERDNVYMVDRANGMITFAPALRSVHQINTEEQYEAIAAVPKSSREIIARYRTGGGIEGNVAPDVLVNLLDNIKGFEGEVTNPERATGGSPIENMENALIRGPLEMRSLERAITAQDFELIASQRSGLVNRAHAYTKRSLWQYAPAGMVEILLVPQVSNEQGVPKPAILRANQNDDVLSQIEQALEMRKPLGSTCSVAWCHYKTVKVCISLRVHREENRSEVKRRITDRLYKIINPICDGLSQPGWPFGEPLDAYDIYRILSEEPGVKSVDPVVLKVAKVPNENVSNITLDAWQNDTWLSVAGGSLYRTLNDAEGWENIKEWPGEKLMLVKTFPRENRITGSVAGLVAVVTQDQQNKDVSTLYISRNCGESWELARKTDFPINDIAWYEVMGLPNILVATERGLFTQSIDTNKEWKPILVDDSNQSMSIRAVAVATNYRGLNSIVVATPQTTGVYLSVDAGDIFKSIGLKNKIVEVLKIQYRDTRLYIWAGFNAVGSDPGEACVRWQLQDSGDSPEGWRPFKTRWDGGTCTSLAFLDGKVFASSRRKGVLTLDSDNDDPVWAPPNVNCGLPMLALNQFESVDSLALDYTKEGQICVLIGGPKGVFRSIDEGKTFKNCSASEFNDRVTLPSTWLFCSEEHEVSVEYDTPNSSINVND